MSTTIEFVEILKNNPNSAYDFISNNYYKMSESELSSVAKELLYAIYENCEQPQIEKILDDVAVELEE